MFARMISTMSALRLICCLASAQQRSLLIPEKALEQVFAALEATPGRWLATSRLVHTYRYRFFCHAYLADYGYGRLAKK